MRVLDSKTKNILYFFYRLVLPIIDPLKAVIGIVNYPRFILEYAGYKKRNRYKKMSVQDLYPMLHDRTSITPLDSHYYYQELWAFQKILRSKPKKHVDLASKYQFSGFVSLITKSEFVDYRPIQVDLPNLKIVDADVTELPYNDNSIESLSCLHVLDNIGLGRYGDDLNTNGVFESAHEMTRVLKPGGRLYISLPIGRERVCFNAHIVHAPKTVIQMFKGLTLLEFAVVDDNNTFHKKANWHTYQKSDYACGMFLFTKEKSA